MQINLNPTATTNSASSAVSEARPEAALPDLQEGDSFSARVIFSSPEVVHLKTADGALLRARLEGGLVLPEGSEVMLTTVEKGDNLLRLRLADGQAAPTAALTPGSTSLAGKNPSLPPTLAAVVEQIQQAALAAPQKVALFTQALANYPGLSGEDPAVQQALALLSAETTLPEAAAAAAVATTTATATPAAAQHSTQMGQLLQQLAVLLNLPDLATISGSQPSAATEAAAAAAATVAAGAENAPPAAGPLAPLFTLFAPAGEAVITNAPLSGETAPPAVPTASMPGPELAAPWSLSAEAQAAATIPNTAAPATAAAETAALPALSGETVLTALPTETRQELLQLAGQIVTELYQQGTPNPALKDIVAFVERLFSHGGATPQEGGEALHQAARELEVRLNMLSEALERSNLPHKEELLAQTNRLLQQTEALREQKLLCLQIPIQLAEQRQTAELYVYRRDKGGKKLDPRQATILLALNTEHLGRLEALVQVRGKDVDLRLAISRAEAVPFVKEQSSQLSPLLAQAGYRLSSAAVLPLSKATGPNTAQRELENFQRDLRHQIDMHI